MTIDELRPVLEEKLRSMGFELFDLRFFHAGSRSILRVTIDSERGVTIGNCEEVSNELSVVLDVEGFSPGSRYNLEVTSPGIDRPLKAERDYRRITGRPVVVHMVQGVDGKKSVRGEVVKCENGVVTLQVGDKAVDIPLSDIYSGREEIQFK